MNDVIIWQFKNWCLRVWQDIPVDVEKGLAMDFKEWYKLNLPVLKQLYFNNTKHQSDGKKSVQLDLGI